MFRLYASFLSLFRNKEVLTTRNQIAMSRILLSVFSFAFILTSYAQSSVSAAKIMSDIKNGKNISYEGVTITGVLDFTYRNSKEDKLGNHAWWNGSNTVNEDIEVEINFVNCTFEDDVLAYIHVEKTGYTYTADFERNVTFKKCDFKRDAMFKYSEFDGDADFSGTKFGRDNSFKYAEFDNKADFSKTVFEEDAIFKYAEFDEGVSFNGANFRDSWDIKYLDVRGIFSIDRMEVGKEIDAKYTEINGQSFTKYLYESKRN
jgi:hypothetical protein